jgi:hypothetical protein
MGSNFFEGKGDYIVYGSHTGQSNNTLTQYSSEQDADITSTVLFMKNFWAGPSKQGLLVSIFASISEDS